MTVGFLQYLPPTMTFLLACFVYGEPLGVARVLTFLFIWAGICFTWWTTGGGARGQPGVGNVDVERHVDVREAG